MVVQYENSKMIQTFHPNHPTGAGHPFLGNPNDSLDFKAPNRAFSRPSRSLFGGGATL